MTEDEGRAVREYFPFIRKIKDKDIRDKVIKAWVIAWKESGYKNLGEAPFTPNPKDARETLVHHTNATTRLALSAAEQFEEEYGVKVNLDVVLASAILHDMDKAVMFVRKGNEVTVSELGKKIPHGAYGMHIALDVGLPLDIAHIIINHSNSINMEPSTIEGVIVQKAEQVKINARHASAKWNLGEI
jgi:putative nucleotidyltransferase with HDIG domain